MALVGEPDGDAVPAERPQLLDQPVVKFPRPLALQELYDLGPPVQELRAVPPPGMLGVPKREPFRIPGVPGILYEAHLLDSRLEGEGRDRRTYCHGTAPALLVGAGRLGRNEQDLAVLAGCLGLGDGGADVIE